jgi:hypothetical protein
MTTIQRIMRCFYHSVSPGLGTDIHATEEPSGELSTAVVRANGSRLAVVDGNASLHGPSKLPQPLRCVHCSYPSVMRRILAEMLGYRTGHLLQWQFSLVTSGTHMVIDCRYKPLKDWDVGACLWLKMRFSLLKRDWVRPGGTTRRDEVRKARISLPKFLLNPRCPVLTEADEHSSH